MNAVRKHLALPSHPTLLSGRVKLAAVALAAFMTILTLPPAQLPAGTQSDNPRPEAGSLKNWAAGPVRWLMLSSDWKAVRKSKDSRDAAIFIERFWRLRDPEPAMEGNSFRSLFHKRIREADRLYFEEEDRGSLTDRGRAYLLLGPPSHVRITHKPALIWSDTPSERLGTTTRDLEIEIWGYRLEDLPEGIVDAALRQGGKGDQALPLTLSFRHGTARVTLQEGERLLELASRSYLRHEQP